jgi:hypothetical protein
VSFIKVKKKGPVFPKHDGHGGGDEQGIRSSTVKVVVVHVPESRCYSPTPSFN